jgi:hypothetical protein
MALRNQVAGFPEAICLIDYDRCDDLPPVRRPWEEIEATEQPLTVEIMDWIGWGDEAEERPVEVEITPSYPKYSEVLS